MARVRTLPRPVTGVRSADPVRIYLGTIAVGNTRATYAVALEHLVADFGADTDVAMLDSEPDRISGWFAYVWGACSAKTFNIRLTARGSAFGYWRERDWLGGDPLIAARALADALNLSARDALGLVVVLRQDPHWRQQFRKQLTDD